MSPKLYPNYGNSRGVQKSHICVFQTLFGAHIPMTRAATWIVPFGDSHNNSARHRGGSLTHLTGADAPCRAGYGHCCCLLCWHLPSGKTTRGWAITPCSAKHCFGSLATAHHMRVWGYQSSTWLNGLVAFYMKRCKFAQRALVCTDSLVDGFEVCRMEIKHYRAFLNKDISFIS